MCASGTEPVIRAAGDSSQMRSKGEGFHKPQDERFSTELVVLLPTIASEMYFLPGTPVRRIRRPHRPRGRRPKQSLFRLSDFVHPLPSNPMVQTGDGRERARLKKQHSTCPYRRARLKKQHLTCPYWIPNRSRLLILMTGW
jgi:hypothetical protein